MWNDEIKRHVLQYYTQLFENKQPHRLPIKTGKTLAKSLGYPTALLQFITHEYWEHFLPCGNPTSLFSPRTGDRILNLGCGAAIDSFVMASLYEDSIEIVNLDVVFAVLQKASFQGCAASFEHMLSWVCSDGESLPFHGKCFDWVLMNGSFNLFPEKSIILQEIWRVLKPLGMFLGADLCAASILPDYFKQEKDAWAWCMSGACTEQILAQLFESHGFRRTKLIREEENEDMLYRVIFSCQKS